MRAVQQVVVEGNLCVLVTVGAGPADGGPLFPSYSGSLSVICYLWWPASAVLLVPHTGEGSRLVAVFYHLVDLDPCNNSLVWASCAWDDA